MRLDPIFDIFESAVKTILENNRTWQPILQKYLFERHSGRKPKLQCSQIRDNFSSYLNSGEEKL